ncbi:ribonuclease H-like domain-containing protein [Rhizophagus clarus]|uniref:Ribonuclease H-like domain-containing protein n=1 Tax=Rhizophagus clarus TaxID=94130 RepID=A0A8H3LB66_9GLOM|nr:ribonuclease H-like domain-containing protein [Rhizophagus clarus]
MHTSTISDQTDCTGTSPVLHYDGAGPIASIPSHNEIVAEYDNRMTAILQQSISGKQPIHFMPTEVSDDTKYVNGVSSYILRITSSLINGQKAIVNITGIKPFFDVEVPEKMSISMFKSRLVKILSSILNSASKFRVKTISAFPLQGYHTEKKPYIRVRTWNHYDRYNALKAVRAVVSVNNYNPISEDDYNNPLFSLALLWDHTLVLTWDIEIYSSRKTGEVSNAKYEEDVVFMICMTVHWKDNPKPLKQICLVNVETAPDL